MEIESDLSLPVPFPYTVARPDGFGHPASLLPGLAQRLLRPIGGLLPEHKDIHLGFSPMHNLGTGCHL